MNIFVEYNNITVCREITDESIESLISNVKDVLNFKDDYITFVLAHEDGSLIEEVNEISSEERILLKYKDPELLTDEEMLYCLSDTKVEIDNIPFQHLDDNGMCELLEDDDITEGDRMYKFKVFVENVMRYCKPIYFDKESGTHILYTNIIGKPLDYISYDSKNRDVSLLYIVAKYIIDEEDKDDEKINNLYLMLDYLLDKGATLNFLNFDQDIDINISEFVQSDGFSVYMMALDSKIERLIKYFESKGSSYDDEIGMIFYEDGNQFSIRDEVWTIRKFMDERDVKNRQ